MDQATKKVQEKSQQEAVAMIYFHRKNYIAHCMLSLIYEHLLTLGTCKLASTFSTKCSCHALDYPIRSQKEK
jgi:hypothetical protein